MKKIILLSSLFLSSIIGYSQNTFPLGTNTAAGIGTGTGAVSGTGGLRLKITSGIAGTSGIQLTNVTSATATTIGNNKALSVDASGNIVLTPVVNTTPVVTNIYTNDGALLSNRTVTLNSNNLNFNSATAGGNLFINGATGNVGIGNISPSEKFEVTGFVKSKTLWASNTATSVSSFATSLDYLRNSYVFGAGYEMADPNLAGSIRRMFNFYDFHAWSTEIAANDDYFVMNVIDRSNKERLTFSGNKAGGPSNGKANFVINDKTGAEIFKLIDDGNNNINLQMGKSNSKLVLEVMQIME